MSQVEEYRAKLRERIDEAISEYEEAETNGDGDFTNDDARDSFQFLCGLQEAMRLLERVCDGADG